MRKKAVLCDAGELGVRAELVAPRPEDLIAGEADSANLGEVRAERATVPDAVLDAVTAGVLSRLRPRYAANRAGSAKLSGRPTTRHPC